MGEPKGPPSRSFQGSTQTEAEVETERTRSREGPGSNPTTGDEKNKDGKILFSDLDVKAKAFQPQRLQNKINIQDFDKLIFRPPVLTPRPPNPMFQSVIKGLPKTEYLKELRFHMVQTLQKLDMWNPKDHTYDSEIVVRIISRTWGQLAKVDAVLWAIIECNRNIVQNVGIKAYWNEGTSKTFNVYIRCYNRAGASFVMDCYMEHPEFEESVATGTSRRINTRQRRGQRNPLFA